MTSFSTTMASALDAFNEDFQKQQPNTGGRQRPPQGEWVNIVKSIEFEQDADTTVKLGENSTIPGFVVKFEYAVFGRSYAIPPEFKQDQTWPGRQFNLPAVPLSKLPPGTSQGKRQNLEISAGRLQGHLRTILGDKYVGNLGADLAAASQAVKDGTVVVRVRCDWQENDKNPDKPFFEEKLMKREA